ncbi:MAG: hypothetical protein K6F78_03605 [Bacteroidaceae bacterium]|nr:hypothetical protein [Bacteroidaceae bacterium]
MSKNTESFLTVLFWGSIWGLIEATLGWGVHKLHIHGTSLFFYSIGIFCMLSCSTRTGKGAYAIMGTAMVAAAIKLLDVFMPMTFLGAINPAKFILLEGLFVVVLNHFLDIKVKYPATLQSFERRMAIPAFFLAAVFTLWLG